MERQTYQISDTEILNWLEETGIQVTYDVNHELWDCGGCKGHTLRLAVQIALCKKRTPHETNKPTESHQGG